MIFLWNTQVVGVLGVTLYEEWRLTLDLTRDVTYTKMILGARWCQRGTGDGPVNSNRWFPSAMRKVTDFLIGCTQHFVTSGSVLSWFCYVNAGQGFQGLIGNCCLHAKCVSRVGSWSSIVGDVFRTHCAIMCDLIGWFPGARAMRSRTFCVKYAMCYLIG